MRPGKEKGFNLLVLLLVIAVAMGGAVWWKLNKKWQQEAAIEAERTAVLLQILDQVRVGERWLAALSLAESTPRVALAGPVGKLQELRQEVAKQKVTGSLIDPTGDLLASMDLIIDGFLTFMRNEPGAKSQMLDKSELANDRLAKYRAALKVCPAPY